MQRLLATLIKERSLGGRIGPGLFFCSVVFAFLVATQ